MKTLAIIVCALTLLSNHARAEERKLVWSDEFNYEGLPNSDKWDYEEGFERNHEMQYYMKARKENSRVEKGCLVIEGRKEHMPNPRAGKGLYDWQRDRKFIDYTSASLITKKKFEFTYGRVEVRAKMPRGRGMWPAIWTLGVRFGDIGDPAWPRCGEIDIMEYFGKYPHRITANNHFANPKITDKAVHNSYGFAKITIQDPYKDFHVYAIEWDEKNILFFVDDKQYTSFRIDIAGKGPDNPFRKPHFLLLNLALGGSAGGKIDDAVLPQKYVIDYVRIYEPKTGQQTDSGIDRLGGSDGLVNGGSWVIDNPPQNLGGWQKTSDSDYVRLPLAVNVAEGTFEGWFKTSSASADWKNPLATSIRALAEPTSYDSMRIEVTATNTYVFDSPGAGTITTGVDITDDQWHLLSLVYEDGQPVQLFVDGGASIGTSPGNYDAALAYDRGFTMLGSRDVGGQEGWRGTVGTFTYYARALSASEIATHFEAGIPLVPEPGTLDKK